MQDFDVKKSKMLALFVFFAPSKTSKAAPAALDVLLLFSFGLFFLNICLYLRTQNW